MPVMNKNVLGVLERHGYLRGRLKTGLDISPCDLKDWSSAPFGFVCTGTESIRNFLQGFTEDEIAKSARWACLYAVYIKKDHFPEGEHAMRTCKSTQHWWEYYKSEMIDLDRKKDREEDRKRGLYK